MAHTPDTEHKAAALAVAAYELFAKHGFKEVNLDQIAARAGVTKGSVYWHYKSKDELVQAACQHYYRSWMRHVQALLAPVGDPAQRLRSVIVFSVESCVMNREHRVFTAEIFSASLHDEHIRSGWAQFYDTARETYVGLLNAAWHANGRPGKDPYRAVNLMLAAMEGIKQRASFEPQVCAPKSQNQLAEDLLSILLASAF